MGHIRWSSLTGPDKQADHRGAENETLAPAETRQIYVGTCDAGPPCMKHNAFEITPMSDATTGHQAATRPRPGLWNVKPLLSGEHKLLKAQVDVLERQCRRHVWPVINGVARSGSIFTVKVDKASEALGAIDQASKVGDKLTGLFSSWQKAIVALVALLGAVGLLLWKLGLRKAKPE